MLNPGCWKCPDSKSTPYPRSTHPSNCTGELGDAGGGLGGGFCMTTTEGEWYQSPVAASAAVCSPAVLPLAKDESEHQGSRRERVVWRAGIRLTLHLRIALTGAACYCTPSCQKLPYSVRAGLRWRLPRLLRRLQHRILLTRRCAANTGGGRGCAPRAGAPRRLRAGGRLGPSMVFWSGGANKEGERPADDDATVVLLDPAPGTGALLLGPLLVLARVQATRACPSQAASSAPLA